MAITLNGTTGIDIGSTTRGMVEASWTTAGRPATPSAGQFGFNTTLAAVEFYNGTAWVPLQAATYSPYTASYLLVAGGGSGGGSSPGAVAGGGGAGGFLTGTTTLSVGTVYTDL